MLKKKKALTPEELAEQIGAKITDSLKDILASNKEPKKIKNKKAKLNKSLNKNVKFANREIKLYQLGNGKFVKAKCDENTNELGEWFRALLTRNVKGMQDSYNKLENGMVEKFQPLVEGTANMGGNLVPTLLYNYLVPLLEDRAVIKARSTLIDMSAMKTNQLNISGIESKPLAQWGSENVAKATSSMQFNQISLTPYLLAAIVPFSMQLRDDSPFNIVQLIVKALGEAYIKAEEKAFATGVGTTQPTGFNTYTPIYTRNAGGAVTYDHIVSAYWRMPQAYREKAVWIMNGRCMEAVSMLKDSNNRPLLLDNGVITQSGMPTIKGRPVLEQNDLPSAEIDFVDLSAYYIGEKLPMTIDIADQATVAGVSLWERNLIAVRLEGRVDGELSTTRAFTRVSNTGIS